MEPCRDLAVLYLHCGRPAAARAELEHFAARAAKVRVSVLVALAAQALRITPGAPQA